MKTQRSVCAMAVALLAGAAACSGPEAPAPGASTSGRAAATARAPAPTGDCDLITQQEVEKALGGVLTVRSMVGRGPRGSGCVIRVAQGDGSEVVVQAMGRTMFEQIKAGVEYNNIPVRPIDMGTEAFQIGQGDVVAINDNDQAIRVSMILVLFGTDMPFSVEAAGVAVQDIARIAFDRL